MITLLIIDFLVSVLLLNILYFMIKCDIDYEKGDLKIKHLLLAYLFAIVPFLSTITYIVFIICILSNSSVKFDFSEYEHLHKIQLFLNKPL